MSHIRELKVGIGSYTAGDDVLQVEGNVSVVGVVSTTSGIDITGVSTLAGNVFVGSAVSIYASSGIVSATSFYGDGSNLTGVSGSGISDVVEDTTPQLGGNLDLNSKDITGTGNLNITGVVTATSFVFKKPVASHDTIELTTGRYTLTPGDQFKLSSSVNSKIDVTISVLETLI